MFFKTLIVLSVAAAFSVATPAKRAPALEVTLSGPTSVDSIDDIKMTAIVTNTGTDSVKVLKYGTVLDGERHTRSFTVSKDGVDADFMGLRLQLDMNNLGDPATVVIPAGGSVTVEHQVAPLFDFEKLGTGIYTFEPVTSFQVIEENARPNAYAVTAAKMDVEVKSDVARRELKVINKRAKDVCSDSTKKAFIDNSVVDGKQLANLAVNYIKTNGANALFKSYFGTTPTATVSTVFSNVANENSMTRTLDCSDPYNACDGRTIAYTVIATTNIYYCNIFYVEKRNTALCAGTTVADRNIAGGTTLHEFTHALSKTIDSGYGCAYDQQLAALSPSRAANNADNYNCFSTQVYASTQCP